MCGGGPVLCKTGEAPGKAPYYCTAHDSGDHPLREQRIGRPSRPRRRPGKLFKYHLCEKARVRITIWAQDQGKQPTSIIVSRKVHHSSCMHAIQSVGHGARPLRTALYASCTMHTVQIHNLQNQSRMLFSVIKNPAPCQYLDIIYPVSEQVLCNRSRSILYRGRAVHD